MAQNRVNRGKDFEGQVQAGFELIPGVSIDRLPDPMAGYAGVKNICDFIVYKHPLQYYIECKSCYGNTMSIHSNDPKKKYGNITNNQWEGLLEKSQIPGVKAGILVWFIDHDETYWIDIRLLQRHRDAGHKSISYYCDFVDLMPETDELWSRIVGKKRRVLFDYDFTDFLKEMSYYGERELSV
jgi:hypothetical protein